MTLVQNDAEIGEIVLRAFILRRASFVNSGVGDIVLVGLSHSANTVRLKAFLTRNGHPYTYLDIERDKEIEPFIATFGVAVTDIRHDMPRPSRPTQSINSRGCRLPRLQRLDRTDAPSRCGGHRCRPLRTGLRRLWRIGGAQRSRDREQRSGRPGRFQFPHWKITSASRPGSRDESSRRGRTRKPKSSARSFFFDRAVQLHCDRTPYRIQLEHGGEITARTIVSQTAYGPKKPPLTDVDRFENCGIFYAATPVESQLCAGEEVVVVGGGNSAGQAAVSLAKSAARVYILVRSANLASSMSRYLIRQIEDTPNIDLLLNTEIIALQGDERLRGVRWKNGKSGQVEERAIGYVFMMTGASPNTAWLSGCVALDEFGFIKTGSNLTREELSEAGWAPARPPYLLETSLEGVFAVGDARATSVKRVASAVGEGSISISFVHQILEQ